MEDLNTLAADCIVISCCCQCLVLQILIFVLLRVPSKFFKKVRGYARRLRNRKKEEKTMQRGRRDDGLRDDSFRSRSRSRSSFRILLDGFALDESHSFGCCADEVENVLEELSQKGAFSFGSFYDEEVLGSFSSYLSKQELNYGVVQYHLINTFASSKCL